MHHKNILLFGAGKSATVLIDYLIEVAGEHNWLLTVADGNVVALSVEGKSLATIERKETAPVLPFGVAKN